MIGKYLVKTFAFAGVLACCIFPFAGWGANPKAPKIEQKKEAEETPEKQLVKSCLEDLFRKQLGREIKCIDIVNSLETAPNTYTGKAIFYETSTEPPFDTKKYYAEISYEFIGDNIEITLMSRDFSSLPMNADDEKYAQRIAEERRIARSLRIAEARRSVKPLMDSLILCPAGSFMMGSPSHEDGRWSGETRHRVTLTQDFYIGKYEVTQAQYKAVMGENPSDFKGDDRPVEEVSWHDAMKFCEKLNELTEGKRLAGYRFSLPTEAQWEYACRAGSTGAYAGILDSMGWYDDNSGKQTHPVGQKRPNAWGIYDMHGNVWEWCLDWYGNYTGDVTDPAGPYSGSSLVGRGGCWLSDARSCRSASRCNLGGPGYRSFNLGFRVALVPVQ